LNNYEVLYILNSDQDDETIAAQAEKFNALVASNGGEVLKADMWGRRRLAYPIKLKSESKVKNEGYYVLMNIKAGPDLPRELERNFSISDEVMRYIVVRQEG
jgi:small subunit ribosomal protein S6